MKKKTKTRRKPAKSKKSIKYAEGTIFAVPLKNKKYVVGVIARGSNRTRILFCYFFSPQLSLSQISKIKSGSELRAKSAVYVRRLGDLGLHLGEWPLLGTVEPWHREEWPMPKFGRIGLLTDIHSLVEYDDHDPSILVCVTEIANCKGYPEDGLSGSGSIEKYLLNFIPAKLAKSPMSANRRSRGFPDRVLTKK